MTAQTAGQSDLRLGSVVCVHRDIIRPTSGNEHQGDGVIWRCEDQNNYYI